MKKSKKSKMTTQLTFSNHPTKNRGNNSKRFLNTFICLETALQTCTHLIKISLAGTRMVSSADLEVLFSNKIASNKIKYLTIKEHNMLTYKTYIGTYCENEFEFEIFGG